MKKIRVIAFLTALISVLLVACGEQQKFEPAEIITTTKQTTEATTYAYSDYSVLGTNMGMTAAETQKALGVSTELSSTENGIIYFVVDKTGLPFITAGKSATVFFIFDGNARLSEIQYISTKDTGFSLDEAIKKYDGLYGKHAKVQAQTDKVNYVWYTGGIYALITVSGNGQNALSFFSKDYFEKTNAEEVQAYKKAQ